MTCPSIDELLFIVSMWRIQCLPGKMMTTLDVVHVTLNLYDHLYADWKFLSNLKAKSFQVFFLCH